MGLESVLLQYFSMLGLAAGLGAALLWLGAELIEAARAARVSPSGHPMLGALALAATGLWWPAHAHQTDGWAALSWLAALAAVTMALGGGATGPVQGKAALMLRLWLLRLGRIALLLPVWVACAVLAWSADLGDPLAAWRAVGPAAGLQAGALMLLPLLRGVAWPVRLSRAVLALSAIVAPLLASLLLGAAPLMPAPATLLAPLLAAFVGLVMLSLLRDVAMPLPQKLQKPQKRAVDEGQRLVDPLTKLMTRSGIELHLAEAAADCDRQDGRLAVMMLNLDGFNPVNSSFGHQFGDMLLIKVAERLRRRLGAGDAAARIGSDDFVIVLVKAGDKSLITEFAMATLAELSRPYRVDGREVSVSCSIGIAQYPDDGGQSRLLSCADAAKNAAKRLGGACHCFYMHGMDGNAREQMDLLRDLRRAVERKELELFYQPKIDALSGEVTAAEALLRWHHPLRGLVAPAVFIPIAERFGFMRELGNWVIDDACRQAQRWRGHGLRMRLAINLSAQQMRQADIVERIAGALARHHVQPGLLTCEITESVAMEDTQATQETFRRLGELGVHLSIDDFGTGYSSLSYLRRLPAAELKIDSAFITDIASSQDARAVVDAVIKLAHALGLRVVAEGIELQTQQLILAGMGCDEFQGYLFARPMSAQAILLWATDEQNAAPAFRASLFGDTIQTDTR